MSLTHCLKFEPKVYNKSFINAQSIPMGKANKAKCTHNILLGIQSKHKKIVVHKT